MFIGLYKNRAICQGTDDMNGLTKTTIVIFITTHTYPYFITIIFFVNLYSSKRILHHTEFQTRKFVVGYYNTHAFLIKRIKDFLRSNSSLGLYIYTDTHSFIFSTETN